MLHPPGKHLDIPWARKLPYPFPSIVLAGVQHPGHHGAASSTPILLHFLEVGMKLISAFYRMHALRVKLPGYKILNPFPDRYLQYAFCILGPESVSDQLFVLVASYRTDKVTDKLK